jgi:hypothetical protein
MKRLFHIGRGELRRPAILAKFVLLGLAFLFISVYRLLVVGNPAQPNDNGARAEATVPPAQRYDISNVPPATKQADREFLKQVEAWEARQSPSPSDSPSAASDLSASQSNPAAAHRAVTAQLHLKGDYARRVSGSRGSVNNHPHNSSSLALTGHTTLANNDFFHRIFHKVLHLRL